MYLYPVCQIHLSNESSVITISVNDIWCLKVLPNRDQQIIGEVEVARRMQANVLFCVYNRTNQLKKNKKNNYNYMFIFRFH